MRNGFIQVCEEVTITMLKTAHSVIFNEGKDLSTGVFDRDGRLIAQDKQGCPVHIAAMPQSVKAGIAQYGIENMNPGDVFLVNDSYSGGTHLPDVTIFAPGVLGGRARRLHRQPRPPHRRRRHGAGSMPGDATEMYQEGLILPAVRIFTAGERNRDVWNIMLANVRLPGNTEGDIAAQMAGVQTGMRRFHSMLERYGTATSCGPGSTRSSPTPSATCARRSRRCRTGPTASPTTWTPTASPGRRCASRSPRASPAATSSSTSPAPTRRSAAP